MLIDFHTHAFPDKIAERALAHLIEGMVRIHGKNELPPRTDGTVSGLLRNMDENGVDISVVLPIATTVTQHKSINDFAEAITSDRIISFGSVHPYQEDWEEALENLSERGLKGIKLHPEFQSFYVDEPVIADIVKKAEALEMNVVLHCGVDFGYEPPVRCTPERLCKLIEKTGGSNIIAAHTGGFNMWEDVKQLIAGTPVYMDISMSDGYLSTELFEKITEKHGTDRLLFGSDSPWQSPSQGLRFLEKTSLSTDDKEKICYKNALKLLKL